MNSAVLLRLGKRFRNRAMQWLGLVFLGCGSAQSATAPSDQVQGPGEQPQEISVHSGSSANTPAPRPRASGARPMETEAPAPLILPRQVLNRVLTAGPGRFLQQVPLVPVVRPGHQFDGFRIVSVYGNNPEVLRFGVLPGDILDSLAGKRIITPGDLMAAFDGLRNANELQVQVRRNGNPLIFRVPIEPAVPGSP